MLREITFDSKKIPAFLDGAINAMALYKQTGIINLFDKCTVTAPIDYTTTGYGTITFNDGAIVICGRVVYIEAGTTLAIPITTTAGGSIGVKVDLNQNAGSQVAFYTKTTQTLTQQDLNENRADGIYEFEIFKYTSNGTTLVLTYQTASVFDANETIFEGIFDGTLKVAVAEIAEYADEDTTKGTIEERLTNLGFKTGTITEANSFSVTGTPVRTGNYVLIPSLEITPPTSSTSPKTNVTGIIDENFRPKETLSIRGKFVKIESGSETNYLCTFSIYTNGEIKITYWTMPSPLNWSYASFSNIGFEANPIT